jgi:hypothetical protein
MRTKNLISRAAWELLVGRFNVEPPMNLNTLWATRLTNTYSIRVTACTSSTPEAVRRTAARLVPEDKRFDVIVVPTRVSCEFATLRDGTKAAVFSIPQLRRGVTSLGGRGIQRVLKPKKK